MNKWGRFFGCGECWNVVYNLKDIYIELDNQKYRQIKIPYEFECSFRANKRGHCKI